MDCIDGPKLELLFHVSQVPVSILVIGEEWVTKNIVCPTAAEDWDAYDRIVIANQKKVLTLKGKLLIALMRLQSPSYLSDENKDSYKRCLSRNVEKMVEIAKDLEHPEILSILLEVGVLNKKKQQFIQQAVSSL